MEHYNNIDFYLSMGLIVIQNFLMGNAYIAELLHPIKIQLGKYAKF